MGIVTVFCAFVNLKTVVVRQLLAEHCREAQGIGYFFAAEWFIFAASFFGNGVTQIQQA